MRKGTLFALCSAQGSFKNSQSLPVPARFPKAISTRKSRLMFVLKKGNVDKQDLHISADLCFMFTSSELPDMLARLLASILAYEEFQ